MSKSSININDISKNEFEAILDDFINENTTKNTTKNTIKNKKFVSKNTSKYSNEKSSNFTCICKYKNEILNGENKYTY